MIFSVGGGYPQQVGENFGGIVQHNVTYRENVACGVDVAYARLKDWTRLPLPPHHLLLY